MWRVILAFPFTEKQYLWKEMLERIREIERNEKVASNRTHRLKCLGNALVPQIAEFIGHQIIRRENG